MGPQYVTDEVNEAFGEFCEHHAEMVEEREGNTGDTDLLLRWMNAELDGQKLEEEQLLFEHALLLVGGAVFEGAAVSFLFIVIAHEFLLLKNEEMATKAQSLHGMAPRRASIEAHKPTTDCIRLPNPESRIPNSKQPRLTPAETPVAGSGNRAAESPDRAPFPN